jgi:hypothetical protein
LKKLTSKEEAWRLGTFLQLSPFRQQSKLIGAAFRVTERVQQMLQILLEIVLEAIRNQQNRRGQLAVIQEEVEKEHPKDLCRVEAELETPHRIDRALASSAKTPLS